MSIFSLKGNSFVIEQYREKYETQFQQLISLIDDKKERSEFEYFPFLENVEELLINNAQRDEIITSLRHCKLGKEIKDFFTFFKQCSSCYRWFCRDKHMSSTSSKCTYC